MTLTAIAPARAPIACIGMRATSDGDSAELARLAKEAARGMTVRQLNTKTGVNRTTLSLLLRGEKVSAGSLAMFAAGLGVPLNPLRVASGLEPIYPDPTASGDQEIEYVPSSLTITIEGYDDLTDNEKHATEEELKRQGESLARAFREARRRAGTIGFGRGRYEDEE